MHGLSGCQTNVLRFVKHAIATEGAPPTIREIADAFSVTPRAAYDHVQALVRTRQARRWPARAKYSLGSRDSGCRKPLSK